MKETKFIKINTLDYCKLEYENLTQLEQNNHDYIICSMFTNNYYKYLNRFKYSILNQNLPVAIYLLPDIHHSITMKGSEDMRFTKHNFILSCLERYQTDILFLDIDLVLLSYPYIFDFINTDFAIYNWLADLENTGYIFDQNQNKYTPAQEIRYYTTDQMIGTGPVHYWKPTEASKILLTNLATYLAKTPYASDDHMIDIFYNFRDFDISATWLPKEYCRFPWYPHIKPVILHTDWPAPAQNRPSNDLKKIDVFRCQIRTNKPQDINCLTLYNY